MRVNGVIQVRTSKSTSLYNPNDYRMGGTKVVKSFNPELRAQFLLRNAVARYLQENGKPMHHMKQKALLKQLREGLGA